MVDGGTGAVLDTRELDGAGDGDGRVARCIVELASVVDGVLIEVGSAAVGEGAVLASRKTFRMEMCFFPDTKVDKREGIQCTSHSKSASPFVPPLVEQ